MDKFSVTQEIIDNKMHIAISGNINENSDFPEINSAQCSHISLNLAKVSAINSLGIKNWVTWINKLPANCELHLDHCPKSIIDQVNTISRFLPPNAIIDSFYVPYYSDITGEEKQTLFTYGREYTKYVFSPPSAVYDSQNNLMEMDVLVNKYFKFLPCHIIEAPHPTVLLVDHDNATREYLAKAINEAGYQLYTASNTIEALQSFTDNQINIIVLNEFPDQSGIEFGLKLRKKWNHAELILILLVNTETKEALITKYQEKLSPQKIFVRPIKNTDLIQYLEECNSFFRLPPQKMLNYLLTQPNADRRDIIKTIECLDQITGMQLPMILSLLEEASISGHLNIITANHEIHGFSVKDGYVTINCGLEHDHITGRILIEKGYLTPELLDTFATANNNDNLITYLGKHLPADKVRQAIIEIITNQLSRIITPETLTINFSKSEITLDSSVAIDGETLTALLHDLCVAKISHEWLQNYYSTWQDYKLQKGPKFSTKHKIFALPLFIKLPSFLLHLKFGNSLSEILSSHQNESELYLRAIHLLFIRRLLVFGTQVAIENPEQRALWLKKISTEAQNKNTNDLLTMMGINANASQIEINDAYQTFIKKLTIKPTDNEEYQALVAKVQDVFKNAHDRAITPHLREKPISKPITNTIAAAQKPAATDGQTLFNHTQQLIQQGQYQNALKELRHLKESKLVTKNLDIYIAWTKLQMLRDTKPNETEITQLRTDIAQIPAEDQSHPMYFCVLALFEKYRNNFAEAEKLLRKCIFLHPTFLQAKRELNILKIQKNSMATDLISTLKKMFTK